MRLFTSFDSAMRCLRTATFHSLSPLSLVKGQDRNWGRRCVLRSATKDVQPPKMAPSMTTDTSRSVSAIDWDSLDFGLSHNGHVSPFSLFKISLTFFQVMYKATADASGNFKGGICPYGALEIMPAGQVLNYGQSIFEGVYFTPIICILSFHVQE